MATTMGAGFPTRLSNLDSARTAPVASLFSRSKISAINSVSSQVNAPDVLSTYAIPASQAAVITPLIILQFFSNCTDLFIRQSRVAMIFAPSALSQSCRVCMFDVFRCRNIFKIIWAIVSLYAVLVVYLKTLRSWPKKRLGNYDVSANIKALSRMRGFVKTVNGISFLVDLRLQDTSTSCSLDGNTSTQSSEIANFVVRESWNRFPNLFDVGRIVNSHDLFSFVEKFVVRLATMLAHRGGPLHLWRHCTVYA